MKQKIIFTAVLLLAMRPGSCCAMDWLRKKVVAVKERVQDALRNVGPEETDVLLDSVVIETEETRLRLAQLALKEDPAGRDKAIARAVKFLNDNKKNRANKEPALTFIVEQVKDSFIGITPDTKKAVLGVMGRWFVFFVEKHHEKMVAFYPDLISCFDLGLRDEDASVHARVLPKAIQVWVAITQHQRAEIDATLFQEFLDRAARVALQNLDYLFAQVFINDLIQHEQCLDLIESIACGNGDTDGCVRQQLQEIVLQLPPQVEVAAASGDGESSESMAGPPQLRLADLRDQVLTTVRATRDESLQSPVLCRVLLQHGAEVINPLVGLRGALAAEQGGRRIVELFDICWQQKNLGDCLAIICEVFLGESLIAKKNAQVVVLELFNRFMGGKIPPAQLGAFFEQLQPFIACWADCEERAAHECLIAFIKRVVETIPLDSGWHTPVLRGYEVLLSSILDKNIFAQHLSHALEFINDRAKSYKYWGVEEGLLRLWARRGEHVFLCDRDVRAEGLKLFLRDCFTANYFELHGQELVEALAPNEQAPAMRFVDFLQPAVQKLLQNNETHVSRFAALLLRRCAELRVGGDEPALSQIVEFVKNDCCHGSVDFARAILSFVSMMVQGPEEPVDHSKLDHIVALLWECMATNNEETFLGALALLKVVAQCEQCDRRRIAEIAGYALMRAQCCCWVDEFSTCSEVLHSQRFFNGHNYVQTRTKEPVVVGGQRVVDGEQGPGYYTNHAEILSLAREILVIVR